VLEIGLGWAFGAAAAAVYWRFLRRARRASPPLPPMDPLLTVRFNATVGIDTWGSSPAYSGHVQLDTRHLVVTLDRGHRAVVERSRVRRLTSHGLFGFVVEHDGEQHLSFGLERRDDARFLAEAQRLGWPVGDVGLRLPPQV
jgi:hypothetical protein